MRSHECPWADNVPRSHEYWDDRPLTFLTNARAELGNLLKQLELSRVCALDSRDGLADLAGGRDVQDRSALVLVG